MAGTSGACAAVVLLGVAAGSFVAMLGVDIRLISGSLGVFLSRRGLGVFRLPLALLCFLGCILLALCVFGLLLLALRQLRLLLLAVEHRLLLPDLPEPLLRLARFLTQPGAPVSNRGFCTSLPWDLGPVFRLHNLWGTLLSPIGIAFSFPRLQLCSQRFRVVTPLGRGCSWRRSGLTSCVRWLVCDRGGQSCRC